MKPSHLFFVSFKLYFYCPIREICPDTPVAAESTTPVYQPSYANAADIISDVHRVDHCRFYQLFPMQPTYVSSHKEDLS